MIEGLLITRHSGWTAITLDRPERRNALNTAMLIGFAETLTAAADAPETRCVLIQGAGGHFAAGADITEIADKTTEDATADPRKPAWAAIRAFPKPLVASVDGYCLGGGCELAMMADVIFAGPTARFGLPETSLGFIPGAGGLHRLTQRIGPTRAAWMAFGGEIIDVETANAWGLVSQRTDGPAEVAAIAYAKKLAGRAPLALAAAKASLVDAAEGPTADGLARERARFEALMDSDDKREGVAAFREKRTPVFQGR